MSDDASHAHLGDEPAEGDGLMGYYEWQVTTLMLAYDLVDPVPSENDQRIEQRRSEVMQEVSDLVRQLLPQEYLDNPERDFPPEVMMRITRATLARAVDIADL